MEKAKLVDTFIFPPPYGLASNWSRLPAPTLLPATSAAAHVLQTKVKTVPQRRQTGRERGREQARADALQAKQLSTGHLLCRVSPKPSVPAGGPLAAQLSQCWDTGGGSRSRAPADSSSGEDNREDQVPDVQGMRIRLEIHSPPAEAQREPAAGPRQGDMGKAAERESERRDGPPGQPRGLDEGPSLESLLPGNKPRSRKPDPLTPPPLPLLLSISPSSCTVPACTLNGPLCTSSSSSSSPSSSQPLAAAASSSSSSRHWAPPKGFWRLARPETLLLNGLGPRHAPAPPPAPPRDGGQKTEATSTSAAVVAVAAAAAVADGDADLFRFKHSDSLERYFDKHERTQREAGGGRRRTGSLESLSSLSPQSEPAAGVREQAEAKPRVCGRPKVRGRRSNREEREPGSRDSAGHTEADGKEEPKVSSLGDPGARSRRYGCSRVRFEDESETEAGSRLLDLLRERGRPGKTPEDPGKTRLKGTMVPDSADNAGSGSDEGWGHRSTSAPVPQSRQEEVISSTATATTSITVIKEIIVVVQKCEACGSIQPLTVTFAGAFVLGESEERGSGWRGSGFGKLRRRSLKGQSRLESGHGPYGPSWAQRRNSNPRNRTHPGRAVSFAPGSPVDLEHSVCEAPGGPTREPSRPPLPIKSALKSKNRSPAGRSSVQPQTAANQMGVEGCGSQHADLPESPETRREGPLTQGTPTTASLVPCIRPSSLKYCTARLTPDLPPAEHWDATPDGPARAEDLRSELLRAEHLKAEAQWEYIVDAPRKATGEHDGRPKLSLRRFFSSLGLNSVGKLVKGPRSSSMEQLSQPAGPRGALGAPGGVSPSPSPTRRPQHPVHIQRTPSLQSLHTVLPLAQLRKACSVQSLERRTERSTVLGEVQIPHGPAPSPVSSTQVELCGGLSAEDDPVLSRAMVRPVAGKVTQALPDGTLVLELTRPPNEPFGFLISRGKGRADTGHHLYSIIL
ncbi:hypothetical protein NHX12_004739 [Muraenolepis orangiensis]|uniref:DUF4685 domain-containing protein n=1 Tax=Muraenolepis orangiensis TaxID=630683 RepID=A0A9Q0IEK8_9TELE|nr:hypothetical protein NHX12_004739 [Muraenolepis orangiensis]